MENSFPAADGRIKFVGGDQELRTPTLIRDHPIRGEDHRDFLGESEGSAPPPPQDTSGCRWSTTWFLVHFRKLSYTAITLNPESNFTRREKNHFLYHWSTLTSPELHIRIWMSSKSDASMIIGILMGLETCQILGQVSHNLLYWKKTYKRAKMTQPNPSPNSFMQQNERKSIENPKSQRKKSQW